MSISVNPTSLNFPDTPIGTTSASLTVVVTNNDPVNQVLLTVVSNNNVKPFPINDTAVLPNPRKFYLPNLPIAGGATRTIWVWFEPKVRTTYSFPIAFSIPGQNISVPTVGKGI